MATIPPQRPRNAPGPKKTRARKLRNVHDCLDPALCKWAELMADPFNSRHAGITFPINKDGFPCPRFPIRNYCTYDLVCGPSISDIGLWFFPTGVNLGGNSYTWRPWTDAVPVTRMIGPCCNQAVGGIVTQTAPWCFVFQQASSFAAIDTMTVQGNSAANTMVPFETMPEVTLNESQNGYSRSNGRTVAYGVRVSYTGSLGNTKGYVEFFQPTECPPTGIILGSTNTMSANRRGVAFRRHYFSSHRTFTYVWEPICDEIDDVQISGSGTPSQNIVGCRLAAHIGGTVENDSFAVEVISFQELSGTPWAQSAIPVPQSPDAVHMANAIVANYGMVNTGGDAHGSQQEPQPLHISAALDKLKYTAGVVTSARQAAASVAEIVGL